MTMLYYFPIKQHSICCEKFRITALSSLIGAKPIGVLRLVLRNSSLTSDYTLLFEISIHSKFGIFCHHSEVFYIDKGE